MTSLRKAALYYDLFCAINRGRLHGYEQIESAALQPEQILMYLDAARAKPGDDVWSQAEAFLGRAINPEELTNGR